MSHDHGSPSPDQGPGGEEHQRLWRVLAEVVGAADPVPPEVLQSGRDSFAWRTTRQLTFEAPELTVGVEVTVLGSHRRLIGQLVPAQRALVTVRHQQGGMVAVEADELGRFRAEDVPSGLSSLRCQLGGVEEGTALVTDWIVL